MLLALTAFTALRKLLGRPLPFWLLLKRCFTAVGIDRYLYWMPIALHIVQRRLPAAFLSFALCAAAFFCYSSFCSSSSTSRSCFLIAALSASSAASVSSARDVLMAQVLTLRAVQSRAESDVRVDAAALSSATGLTSSRLPRAVDHTEVSASDLSVRGVPASEILGVHASGRAVAFDVDLALRAGCDRADNMVHALSQWAVTRLPFLSVKNLTLHRVRSMLEQHIHMKAFVAGI
jgi:hypothetical protein